MLSARVGQYFKWVGQSPEWVGHGLPGLGLEPPLPGVYMGPSFYPRFYGKHYAVDRVLWNSSFILVWFLKKTRIRFRMSLVRFLSARWMQAKLFLSLFNLNCRLHAVSVGKPSALMSNFWTVWVQFGYLYLNLNRILVFRTHTSCRASLLADCLYSVSKNGPITYSHMTPMYPAHFG